MILCHSLFKVVIHQIPEGREVIGGLVQAVHTVVDGDIPYITLGKETLGVVADFQIIPPHAGHILNDNRFDLSRFCKAYHLIPAGPIESYPRNTVVDEKGWVGKTVVLCVLEQDFLLRRDLSRSVFAKQCAIRIDKQQKERYNNIVIDNGVII